MELLITIALWIIMILLASPWEQLLKNCHIAWERSLSGKKSLDVDACNNFFNVHEFLILYFHLFFSILALFSVNELINWHLCVFVCGVTTLLTSKA